MHRGIERREREHLVAADKTTAIAEGFQPGKNIADSAGCEMAVLAFEHQQGSVPAQNSLRPLQHAELAALGFYSVGICGTDFAHLLRKQYDEFGRVIREANVKAE